MSVITSEELDELRRCVQGVSGLTLVCLQEMTAAQWQHQGPHRHDWFRLRRLVAEEWERRSHAIPDEA